MQEYLISMIIIAYNIEDYLKECLDSIIFQIGNDIEIILVDDASTDHSGKICDLYGKKDNRIKVIHNPINQGAAVARNIGLKQANGEWISFIDGDDMLTEDALKIMRKYKSIDAQLVLFNFLHLKDNRLEKIKQQPIKKRFLSSKEELEEYKLAILGVEEHQNDLWRGVPIHSPWGKMYNREFLINNNIWFNPKLKKAQDIVFAFLAAHYLDKLFVVRENVYIYRHNQSAISWRYSSDIIEKQTLYIEEMYNIINYFQEEKNKKMIELMQYRCLYEMNLCFKLSIYHPDCNWNRKERLKWFKELADTKWIVDIPFDMIKNKEKYRYDLELLHVLKTKNFKKLQYWFYMHYLEKKLKYIL